ncbi:Retrovirus-related Pol polyprotein, partial [Operophtera brumata]
MTSNYIANVPKLKGRENYDDWCFAAKNVLVLEGMATKGNRQSSDMSKPETSKPVKQVKCYRCKQTGHYKNQCPNSEISNRKQSNAFSAIFLSGKFNHNSWYIDSGASKHMTAKQDYIVNPSHQHETKEIIIANQTTVPVLCSGDVNIVTVVNDVEYDITVSDVLCIPSLTTNLLSVSQLIENGNRVIFKENACYIYNKQNELVGQAESVDGVYRLYTLKTELQIAATAIALSATWHRRLGHIN